MARFVLGRAMVETDASLNRFYMRLRKVAGADTIGMNARIACPYYPLRKVIDLGDYRWPKANRLRVSRKSN